MSGAVLPDACGPFFHISPAWCGQDRLARIFQRNGLGVANHENGALAEDILFAQAQGRAPLGQWADARLFTGLYRDGPVWRPPLEGWRQFAFLRRHFPDAVFISTQRDIDGWLLDRLLRDDGQAARCYARYHNLTIAEVPEFWLAEWQAHQQALMQCFGDDPRLIHIDLDQHRPQDVAGLLAPFVDLAQPVWGGALASSCGCSPDRAVG